MPKAAQSRQRRQHGHGRQRQGDLPAMARVPKHLRRIPHRARAESRRLRSPISRLPRRRGHAQARPERLQHRPNAQGLPASRVRPHIEQPPRQPITMKRHTVCLHHDKPIRTNRNEPAKLPNQPFTANAENRGRCEAAGSVPQGVTNRGSRSNSEHFIAYKSFSYFPKYFSNSSGNNSKSSLSGGR